MGVQSLQSVKIEIDSILSNATLVALALRGICQITKLKPLDVDRVELCLMEALNNVIIHAYCNQVEHKIETLISISSSAISLTVSDWGRVMPADKLTAPLTEAERRESIDDALPSGRGLAIIKRIMAGMHYSSENGKNSFYMVMNIQP